MAKVPYLSGFGNVLESEALEGALPIGTVTRLPCFCHLTVKFVSVLGQNSPQITPFNLYPEQISGSAFTVPRASNQKSWLYRIRPSVIHSPYKQIKHDGFLSTFSTGPAEKCLSIPNQLRWSPFEFPNIKNEVNFIQGLHTIAGAGDTSAKNGLAIYIYSANQSMKNEAFYNSDGDFLIVPQCGCLNIQTEFGTLEVEPHEIVVIQRGIRFKVELNGPSRGYAVEIFNGHFELPELGPIGANGLANPRDFLHPTAHFEDAENVEFTIYTKFQGQLFSVKQQHSPFDVVAWHGNYVPFKYDLRKFNTVNTVSFDHLDPSIFTVLTCKSATVGVALVDFVIFPPRWMVAEHTFRPPYFHRNCMSEFMGLISGQYDAKSDGFSPGGGSLHNMMSPHGPDSITFKKGTEEELRPKKLEDGMAFMFETFMTLSVTNWAYDNNKEGGKVLQRDYVNCWADIEKRFKAKL